MADPISRAMMWAIVVFRAPVGHRKWHDRVPRRAAWLPRYRSQASFMRDWPTYSATLRTERGFDATFIVGDAIGHQSVGHGNRSLTSTQVSSGTLEAAARPPAREWRWFRNPAGTI